MRVKLQEISEIISGIYVPDSLDADIFLLQPRHFNTGHDSLECIKPSIKWGPRLSKYLLQLGDVLIIAKGKDHFAIQYEGTPTPSVPSSAFIVIRIRNKAELSASFLCWIINHPNTQKQLSYESQGTDIQALTQANIAGLCFDLPHKSIQDQIVRLIHLQQRKEVLLRNIQILSQQLLQNRLLTISKQNS